MYVDFFESNVQTFGITGIFTLSWKSCSLGFNLIIR